MVHRADLIKDYRAAGTRVVTICSNVEQCRALGFWEDVELKEVVVEVPPLIRVVAGLLAWEVKASVAHRKA